VGARDRLLSGAGAAVVVVARVGEETGSDVGADTDEDSGASEWAASSCKDGVCVRQTDSSGSHSLSSPTDQTSGAEWCCELEVMFAGGGDCSSGADRVL
jgi:hypothetical protein